MLLFRRSLGALADCRLFPSCHLKPGAFVRIRTRQSYKTVLQKQITREGIS